MKEVRLGNIGDPIGFLFDLLKRQLSLLKEIQSHPKTSIAEMYRQNEREIDEAIRDLTVSCNTYQKAVFEVGDGSYTPMHDDHERIVRCTRETVGVVQKYLDLFDSLSVRYRLPQTEYVLFSKIGLLLDGQ